MTDGTELSELEDLIAHPGYARLLAHFDREWGRAGTRYLTMVETLLNTTGHRDEAVTSAQVVIMVRKEMENFFRQIEQRVIQLRGQASAEGHGSPSRRGVL